MKLVLILAAWEGDGKELLEQFPYQGPAYARVVNNPPDDFESLDWMRTASLVATTAIERARIERIEPGPQGLARPAPEPGGKP